MAMIRAAKQNPMFQPCACYRQSVDPEGRPKARHFTYVETGFGALHWPDVDKFERENGGEVGDGRIVVVGVSDPPYSLIQMGDGQMLSVASAGKADALEASFLFEVRRWTGDPPVL